MKYLVLPLLLFAISSRAQVYMQFKNLSDNPIVVIAPLIETRDTIKANGVGHWRQVPAIRTGEEVFILWNGNQQHLNSNRSLKDTVYTTGNFSFQLFYDAKKKKYYSHLKKI